MIHVKFSLPRPLRWQIDHLRIPLRQQFPTQFVKQIRLKQRPIEIEKYRERHLELLRVHYCAMVVGSRILVV